MATYTVISDSVLEPLKPIRSVDGLALRDNPIAIAEGAAGAPRILLGALNDWPWGNEDIRNESVGAEKLQTGTAERDWVLARTSDATTGAVGTYAMLRNTSVGQSPGATASGSDLEYSSADNDTGANPSGTWRCMGKTTNPNVATVYLRIS